MAAHALRPPPRTSRKRRTQGAPHGAPGKPTHPPGNPLWGGHVWGHTGISIALEGHERTAGHRARPDPTPSLKMIFSRRGPPPLPGSGQRPKRPVCAMHFTHTTRPTGRRGAREPPWEATPLAELCQGSAMMGVASAHRRREPAAPAQQGCGREEGQWATSQLPRAYMQQLMRLVGDSLQANPTAPAPPPYVSSSSSNK